MAERRTVLVAARVTRAEHAAWKEKAAAAGVSPSALLRMAMARTQTWTAPPLAAYRERSRQIARIGNNLNQVARWANTHAYALDGVRVMDRLTAVERALRALAPPDGADRGAH
ncbi:MAG: MobC family plasmid mobilization relaxosome protein [Acidobacteria bacterium]|nr:MobC family plasmid mobilization relaxosome protein [Acidobacteriota bacterium]